MAFFMLINQEQPYILPLCDEEIEVIYEDESLIICNKPSGLLSLPGKHPLNQDSLLTRLQAKYKQAALAHRLDLDTSGILLAAKNKIAHAHLNKQFSQREIKKTYQAIVNHRITQANIPSQYQKFIQCRGQPIERGEINLPMCADPSKKPTQKICFEQGKQALSYFSVLSYDSTTDTSNIELHPHTGRSHQLRLHCLSIGNPIIGCDLYADKAAFLKSPRLCLHASAIEFNHPDTLQKMFIYSPAPF